MNASSSSSVSTPLQIVVLWHPACIIGSDYANCIFTAFCDDVSEPDENALGIPVFFRSAPSLHSDEPPGIDFDTAALTVLVVLADEHLTIDPTWRSYMDRMHEREEDMSRQILFLFVPLTTFIQNTLGQFHSAQRIQIHKCDDPDNESNEVCFERRCSRLIGGIGGAIGQALRFDDTDRAGSQRSPSPPVIRVSYVPDEGQDVAESIRDRHGAPYVVRIELSECVWGNGGLSSEEFDCAIAAGAAAIVIIRTDSFGSVECCRREALWAAAPRTDDDNGLYHIPVVVVDRIESFVARDVLSYAGHPPICLWDDAKISRIIDTAMLEILRSLYRRRLLALLRTEYVWPGKPILSACRQDFVSILPQLRRVADSSQQGNVEDQAACLVGVDPPPGASETRWASAVVPGLVFTTPSMCCLCSGATEVESAEILSIPPGMTVHCAVRTSDDLPRIGLGWQQYSLVLTWIGRGLISHGANLAFAGWVYNENIANRFFECARKYTPADRPADVESATMCREVRDRLRIYLQWPDTLELRPLEEAVLSAAATLVKVSPPDGLKINPDYAPQEEDDSPYMAYRRARCISGMREQLAEECDASIFVGGDVQGYRGKLPDTLEEVGISLSRKKPVYLVGMLGGCTRLIIDAIAQPDVFPKELTYSYQVETIARESGFSVSAEEKPRKGHLSGDYEEIRENIQCVNRDSKYGGLRNGLSATENEELFYSANVRRITGLIIKGLSALQRP